MLGAIGRKLFANRNERYLKALYRKVGTINALEPNFRALSDDALAAKTGEFRLRLKNGATLDQVLPEAFATVREAARRVLGQRPYDVQLIGGMVLYDCKIAEMKTGEGKTLVATLPTYLNALLGLGVHVITVNDYLARRDSEWMGQIYRFLGLSVGCILHGLNDSERRAAYGADITYGTNNEFGFDYLRDNMKFRLDEMVQRPFHYAIVDEVDSILVDEARTPLIISGPAEDSSELYIAVNKLIGMLEPTDFDKDEKDRTVVLTEAGQEKAETWLAEQGLLQPGGLYDIANVHVVHHLNQALRAHKLFQADVDYIVKQDKVIIIDEFTGRMMEGRRYSEGLHQALEAKEGVTIQRENQTLATITFQNYFRLYPHLAGMTGTALTEATEFADIYRLDVVEIPTNMPVARQDLEDEIYGTAQEKYAAIVKLIEDCRARQQPVLVGTVSIEKSEVLSEILKKKGIPHNVLNARYHEQEATIVAQAGRLGAITIATNMAGRGTDIKLGGNADMRIASELADVADASERTAKIAAIRAEVQASEAKVKAAGGLYVIGTERHESRRIDNQLRGRSGRQGDPGSSKFFLSLEDDLLRIFGADVIKGLMTRMGLKDGEVIKSRMISRGLERAQEKVESRNYDRRKTLLRYDNVMNDQRKVIYEQRREIMDTADIVAITTDMRDEVISDIVRDALPPNVYPENWELGVLKSRLFDQFGLDLPVEEWGKEDGITPDTITKRIHEASDARLAEKTAALGPESMQSVMRATLLQQIDQNWKDHLLGLEHLRQGINLRAYGQRDPFNEYNREAFLLFSAMMGEVRHSVVATLMKSQISAPSPEQIEQALRNMAAMLASAEEGTGELPEGMVLPPEVIAALRGAKAKAAIAAGSTPTPSAPPAVVATETGISPPAASDPEAWAQTPRNAPCPCGSGKKYKHCHGQAT